MSISPAEISQYINDLFVNQDEALLWAYTDSRQKGLPAINVRPEEGRFLQVLIRASGAQKVVEIGTLGGYSGIWIARGLPPGGRLITLENNPFHAEVAQEHFERAGVAAQVEIRQGDAHQILQALTAEGPFDFVFIDAEKPGYPAYLDWAIENTRLGGVIAAHNALRGGKVVGPEESDENTMIMRAFNHRVAQDSRLLSILYSAGDGTVVAVRIA